MNLSEQSVLPLMKNDRHTPDIAQKALDNIMAPFPNVGEVNFTEDFDWTYRPDPKSDTFQLYLQSLRVVSALLSYYRQVGNIDYVYKAKEITESWLNYIENKEPTNMSWYDHTTANRTQSIIELMFVCQELDISLDRKRYEKILVEHANVLSDDSMHKNNNHSLMMDRSLIMLGIILDNKPFILKGIERAKTVFWVSFSMQGVHLENSPAYHFMVFRIFKEIEDYLNKNDTSLGQEVLRMFPLIDNYKYRIAKPNNFIPGIGDSGRVQLKDNMAYDWRSFSDPASGINVIKNKENQLYLAFISGFATPVHKHADDLSFLVNYKGLDFFEDAGMYKYGRGKNRAYVLSYKGHNTFTTGEKYTKNRDNKVNHLVHTDNFIDTPLYSLVSGYNHAYEDAKLRRSIYYLPAAGVIIGHDSGKSEEKKMWIQNFNVSEKVNVEKVNDAYKLTNEGVSMYLRFNSEDNAEILKGDKEAVVAVNSHKSGAMTETTQIVNTVANENRFEGCFIISFDTDKKVLIKKNNTEIKVNVEGKEYQLPIVQ